MLPKEQLRLYAQAINNNPLTTIAVGLIELCDVLETQIQKQNEILEDIHNAVDALNTKNKPGSV